MKNSLKINNKSKKNEIDPYARCKSCIYRASTSSLWACDYLAFTGHCRMGEPGDKCTKYERGNRLNIKSQLTILNADIIHSKGD